MNDNRDHLRALLAAYVEATGLEVSMSPVRMRVLREIDRFPSRITPEDVRAVLGIVRRAVENGVHGYTDASLDFRNAMKPETLEERVLKMRQARARKAGALRVQAAGTPRAETVAAPQGGTISRMVPAPEAVPNVPLADVKAAVRDLERKLRGGGQ